MLRVEKVDVVWMATTHGKWPNRDARDTRNLVLVLVRGLGHQTWALVQRDLGSPSPPDFREVR